MRKQQSREDCLRNRFFSQKQPEEKENEASTRNLSHGSVVSQDLFFIQNDCLHYRVAQADPVDSATGPLPNVQSPLRPLTTTTDGLNHFFREQPAADLSETRR